MSTNIINSFLRVSTNTARFNILRKMPFHGWVISNEIISNKSDIMPTYSKVDKILFWAPPNSVYSDLYSVQGYQSGYAGVSQCVNSEGGGLQA